MRVCVRERGRWTEREGDTGERRERGGIESFEVNSYSDEVPDALSLHLMKKRNCARFLFDEDVY